MLREERLPTKLVKGNGDVRKLTIGNLDEMSAIAMDERTDIVEHEHGPNQWEVYIDIPNNTAYVCGIGKPHEYPNSTDKEKTLLAIKGRNATEADLAQLFRTLGMDVKLA